MSKSKRFLCTFLAILMLTVVSSIFQPYHVEAAKGSGGGGNPKPKPTPTATVTPAPTSTPIPTSTPVPTPAPTPSPTPSPLPAAAINYVALGDSIATGTIYSGKTITPYVTYFYQFLQAQNSNTQVTLSNLATNGNRTNELYARLGLDTAVIGDSRLITAVSSAEIITISIGGNNLMQAAKDSSSLGGYNFDNINTAIADQGVSDFNTHWVPIIREIKRLNPFAQVIVTTVYNPYNESDQSLHNTVDSYLFRQDGTGINDVIKNNTGLGYTIADVYHSFNSNYANYMGAVTYFYPSPYDLWGSVTRNPHPNENGQNIITGLHRDVYTPITVINN